MRLKHFKHDLTNKNNSYVQKTRYRDNFATMEKILSPPSQYYLLREKDNWFRNCSSVVAEAPGCFLKLAIYDSFSDRQATLDRRVVILWRSPNILWNLAQLSHGCLTQSKKNHNHKTKHHANRETWYESSPAWKISWELCQAAWAVLILFRTEFLPRQSFLCSWIQRSKIHSKDDWFSPSNPILFMIPHNKT